MEIGDVIIIGDNDKYGKLPSHYDGTWNPDFLKVEPYCKGCNRQEEYCICEVDTPLN